MRKLILIAAILCAPFTMAVAQEQKAPQATEQQAEKPADKPAVVQQSAEMQCTSAKQTWSNDRCYTGKRCEMKDGSQGYEARKDNVLGCSRLGPLYTKELQQAMQEPGATEQACAKTSGWWSIDRCFSGKTCVRNDGSQGFQAIKDGVLGCSEFGPKNGLPKQQQQRSNTKRQRDI